MIYLTGDTHGDPIRFSSKRWPEGKTLTKDDTVIVLGDFGMYFDDSPQELNQRKWLAQKPWQQAFVCGNHENFDTIYGFKTVEAFGSHAGLSPDGFVHLRRGHVYEIEGNRVFVFGGGLSIDKAERLHYEKKKGKKVWWEQEYPSEAEMDLAWKNLEACGWEVDYVLTHVPPLSQHPMERKPRFSEFYEVNRANEKRRDRVAIYLEDIKCKLKFKKWYYGHMHEDEQKREDFVALHWKILPLGADLRD